MFSESLLFKQESVKSIPNEYFIKGNLKVINSKEMGKTLGYRNSLKETKGIFGMKVHFFKLTSSELITGFFLS